MSAKEDCCLCNIATGSHRKFGATDTPFYEDEQFIAVTSIGSFIEGWALVVPRAHQLSCSKLYSDASFLSFAAETKRRIEDKYGATILFEHGASIEGSVTGCGVDHAHLHIVPFKQSIENRLRKENLTWHEYAASKIEQISGDYLFYIQDLDASGIKGVYAQPLEATSQFFRKILAEALNVKAVSNYREFPFLETSNRANEILATA
jgi:diadenosine tetraphosphate (Ap4A) HIT family hydrolase